MKLALLSLALSLVPAPAPPPAHTPPSSPSSTSPARLLVRFAATPKDAGDAAILVANLAAASRLPVALERPTLFGWVIVRTPAGLDPAEAARILGAVKGVDAAEPDRRLFALRVPNDPLTADLWGFDAIEAASAWDLSVGLSSQRVGVVDTGIRRDHKDLAAHDKGGFDFVSDPDNAADGDGRDDDYGDEGGANEFHGSHVSGTILARGNDRRGVPGMNWKAGLVTARALGSDGGGDLVDIMEGAAWLAGFDVDGAPSIGANKVSAINMSLGGSARCGKFEHDVIARIVAANVAVIAAAGNDGGPTGSPANCTGVIAVGAVDSNLALASYSSFDARTDVLAPGGDDDNGILSVDGATVDGYKVLEGTSMAAPHVTGVVSLMQSVFPAITPAQIKTILMASPYTCDGCDDHAFLQADNAVAAAKALAAPAPTSGGTHGQSDDGSVDTGTCDPARGNWDCAANSGCVDGACVDGEQGRGSLGEVCGVDAACGSGLCDRGICTRPCDADGCPEGTACDAGEIPGGLCRAPAAASCAQTADTCALLPMVAFVLARLRPRRRGAVAGATRAPYDDSHGDSPIDSRDSEDGAGTAHAALR